MRGFGSIEGGTLIEGVGWGVMPYPGRPGGLLSGGRLMSEHYTNALQYKVLCHLFIHSFIKCIPNTNHEKYQFYLKDWYKPFKNLCTPSN